MLKGSEFVHRQLITRDGGPGEQGRFVSPEAADTLQDLEDDLRQR
jgi:hypothetical protein